LCVCHCRRVSEGQGLISHVGEDRQMGARPSSEKGDLNCELVSLGLVYSFA